ncbi:MAG: DUF4131 domain-containing protein [Halothece sp. Uz-M2-17]|nr:DUF4131 domain-containing protein [Halothece sp. Uz-M2-17]
MYRKNIPLFCLAYIVGLLIAAGIEQYWLTLLSFTVVAGGLVWKFTPDQWSRLQLRSFLIILLIFLTAFSSFYLRFPTPTNKDISQILTSDKNGMNVTITGKVLNAPTSNRAGKLRFWLATESVKQETKKQGVTGKLYATVPTPL